MLYHYRNSISHNVMYCVTTGTIKSQHLLLCHYRNNISYILYCYRNSINYILCFCRNSINYIFCCYRNSYHHAMNKLLRGFWLDVYSPLCQIICSIFWCTTCFVDKVYFITVEEGETFSQYQVVSIFLIHR